MKFRNDFVTNSSSSSFIIINNTDHPMTSCQFAAKMFEFGQVDSNFGYSTDEIISSAKDMFVLEPHSSMEIECADDYENLFETYIHNEIEYYDARQLFSDDIDVYFIESHH